MKIQAAGIFFLHKVARMQETKNSRSVEFSRYFDYDKYKRDLN